MAEKEHPWQVIKRHSEAKDLQPIDLLTRLLDMLQASHRLHATALGLKNSATNQGNVVSEILGICSLMGRANDPPSSLLGYLQIALQLDKSMADNNAKAPTAAGRAEQATHIEGMAKLDEALFLIIQDLINQAEHESLAMSMRVDKFLKENNG